MRRCGGDTDRKRDEEIFRLQGTLHLLPCSCKHHQNSLSQGLVAESFPSLWEAMKSIPNTDKESGQFNGLELGTSQDCTLEIQAHCLRAAASHWTVYFSKWCLGCMSFASINLAKMRSLRSFAHMPDSEPNYFHKITNVHLWFSLCGSETRPGISECKKGRSAERSQLHVWVLGLSPCLWL